MLRTDQVNMDNLIINIIGIGASFIVSASESSAIFVSACVGGIKGCIIGSSIGFGMRQIKKYAYLHSLSNDTRINLNKLEKLGYSYFDDYIIKSRNKTKYPIGDITNYMTHSQKNNYNTYCKIVEPIKNNTQTDLIFPIALGTSFELSRLFQHIMYTHRLFVFPLIIYLFISFRQINKLRLIAEEVSAFNKNQIIIDESDKSDESNIIDN